MTPTASRLVVTSVWLGVVTQPIAQLALAAGPYTLVEVPRSWGDPALNDHDQVVGFFFTTIHVSLLDLRTGTTEDIPYTPSGFEYRYFLLNNEGDILVSHGGVSDLLHDGTQTKIERMNCYGMNDACQVVGKYGLPVLWENGVKTHLGTLGGNWGLADDINNSGMIAGASTLVEDEWDYHAFLYADGVMTDLGTLGGTLSDSYGINESGDVIGWAATADDESTHAFLYADGAMTDLGVLPGTEESFAWGLNDHRQVVGYSAVWGDTDGERRAFLWEDGVMIDLHDLLPEGSTWQLTEALYVNKNGTILGLGINPDGEECSFAMMVVPEPGSFAILLASGFAALWARRRRRAHVRR